jgi:hypothetical protein
MVGSRKSSLTPFIPIYSHGEDLRELIDNCRGLPAKAPKPALHKLRHLANDVLHFKKPQVRLPKDMEKEMLYLLLLVRIVIEGAPTFREH